jgi:broad specificity phosphatase PhoE
MIHPRQTVDPFSFS